MHISPISLPHITTQADIIAIHRQRFVDWCVERELDRSACDGVYRAEHDRSLYLTRRGQSVEADAASDATEAWDSAVAALRELMASGLDEDDALGNYAPKRGSLEDEAREAIAVALDEGAGL